MGTISTTDGPATFERIAKRSAVYLDRTETGDNG